MANENQVIEFIKTHENGIAQYGNQSFKKSEFLRSALLAITENFELKKCMETPAGKSSLFNALKYAASTGLSLNPQEGKAALIAYNGQVSYQVMKNGLIHLAMESGRVSFITADTVRENDLWKIIKTPDGDKYEYSPARKDRGKIDGVFSAVKLDNGACHVKYMTAKEIEDHRDSYSGMYNSQKKEKSPWYKSFEGMALKTVIKALFRNLSISSDMDKAVRIDDKEESQDFKPIPGFNSEDIIQELEKKELPPEPEKKLAPTKGPVGEKSIF